MTATDLFQAGRLDEAVLALGVELRRDPADSKRRAFLVEILCFIPRVRPREEAT
jgi:type VI secretion system protein ImpE